MRQVNLREFSPYQCLESRVRAYIVGGTQRRIEDRLELWLGDRLLYGAAELPPVQEDLCDD